MREIGIDISAQRSKSIDEFAGQEFDYVLTVCDNANQQCPMFSGKTKRMHWIIEDPAAAIGNEEEQLNVFRRIRDELGEKLRNFVAKEGEKRYLARGAAHWSDAGEPRSGRLLCPKN